MLAKAPKPVVGYLTYVRTVLCNFCDKNLLFICLYAAAPP